MSDATLAPALENDLSVTKSVTPKPAESSPHDIRIIGDPKLRPWKVAQVDARLAAGHYDQADVVDASLDPLALELGLDRLPVRDWQVGDLATHTNGGNRYVVQLVTIRRAPDDVVVPAADYRIVEVLIADPVTGLGRGAEGLCPLTALQAPDAA